VTEEWVEAQLLPIAQRDAYYESALIDMFCNTSIVSNVNSLIDCKAVVTKGLNSIVQITTSGVASGAIDRITRKLWLYIHTKSVDVNTELDKLLKSVQKSLTISSSLVELFYKDKEPCLTLSVPDYEDEEDTCKVLVLLFSFVCKLHNCKITNIKINKDPSLGKGRLSISNSLKKLLLDLSASASNPSGLFAGEIYSFKSGFRGNLVDMVAAMRLLNLKQEFIRKRKFLDNSKVPVSFNTLLESFNTSTGLKSTGEVSFIIRFIKSSISSAIKAHNKGFPGGWISSSRRNNNIKTDFALLNVLGWTEKTPSNHKMLEVLFNTVDPDDNDKKKFKVINITQDKRNFLFQEFRTAVALTLPRLDTSKHAMHEAQMKLDPLSVRDLTICNNFCKDKRAELVDSLNESYALRISLKNPKSKTKEIHYKISRDRTLALSANVPLIDAKGQVFSTFSKIPEKTQKFLREKFRYPVKRQISETVPTTQVEDVDIPMEVNSSGKAAQVKRRKLTHGQAAAATRKSGRLARMAEKTTT
jgi:hypothetical protein